MQSQDWRTVTGWKQTVRVQKAIASADLKTLRSVNRRCKQISVLRYWMKCDVLLIRCGNWERVDSDNGTIVYTKSHGTNQLFIFSAVPQFIANLNNYQNQGFHNLRMVLLILVKTSKITTCNIRPIVDLGPWPTSSGRNYARTASYASFYIGVYKPLDPSMSSLSLSLTLHT